MSLIALILLLAAVGFFLWLINVKVPMEATIKMILNIVVILVVVIFLLKLLGLWNSIANVRV